MASELTDEQMAALDRIIVGDDGVRPIMFPWMAKALSELRTRRAREKALVVEVERMRPVYERALEWEQTMDFAATRSPGEAFTCEHGLLSAIYKAKKDGS